MEKLLKKYWGGNIPLVKSYWIGCILVPIALTIPMWPAYSGSVSDGYATFIIIWFFAMLAANVFLLIGGFKSAQKYVALKRKKKQSAGWGIAAQVLIVLGALNVIKEVLTLFT